MTTCIYLLGAPGVGKTTLMDQLLLPYERGTYFKPGWGAFGYEPLTFPVGSHGRVYPSLLPPPVYDVAGIHLGRTRPAFGGTDALSMSVLPSAAKWAEEAPLPPLIFGEGQRLSHPRFLLALNQRSECAVTVVHLSASAGALESRCRQRDSNQDPSWRKASETRALNVLHLLVSHSMNHLSIDTTNLTPDEVYSIVTADVLGEVPA